ncbi:MAG: hypothetical protein IKB52_03270, partial [Kiritimatiellae bacterium]|nr:hypothetical protein [Kiritimatiellia bacterium]
GGALLGGGAPRLYNDLYFFAITEDGVPEAETVVAIGKALHPIAEKWTQQLGVDVDFAVKTPWRIKHDEDRLMIQELVHGYVDVALAKGERLFAGVRALKPGELPWMEAARLLMNRGMGLLMADESGDRGFVARNLNKCVLGAGDARLIAGGRYAWRADERADRLGDGLYSAAVAWKFRPQAEPVANGERAREAWLEAYDEVSALSDASRSLFSALRWVARRRTVGELSTFALPPEVRVLRRIAAEIRAKGAVTPDLRRDWQVFN